MLKYVLENEFKSLVVKTVYWSEPTQQYQRSPVSDNEKSRNKANLKLRHALTSYTIQPGTVGVITKVPPGMEHKQRQCTTMFFM